MNLIKLLNEKKRRNLLRLIVNQTIRELDFTKSIRRSVVHQHVCNLLNKPISNQLVNKINKELLIHEIVPTRSGNKTYYRHVEYCKNYAWLKHKHLKLSELI